MVPVRPLGCLPPCQVVNLECQAHPVPLTALKVQLLHTQPRLFLSGDAVEREGAHQSFNTPVCRTRRWRPTMIFREAHWRVLPSIVANAFLWVTIGTVCSHGSRAWSLHFSKSSKGLAPSSSHRANSCCIQAAIRAAFRRWISSSSSKLRV